MILDSLEFKAMESGIKAMAIKQQVHTHNIANIDTPDYKLKTFSFKNALEDFVCPHSGFSVASVVKNKGKGCFCVIFIIADFCFHFHHLIMILPPFVCYVNVMKK